MGMIKKVSLITSLFILLAGLGLWAAGGFHRGWTQTKIPEVYVDEITEIEVIRFRDGFRAGIEVPLGATLLAAMIAGGGLLCSRCCRSN